jgi:hypothetical protein
MVKVFAVASRTSGRDAVESSPPASGQSTLLSLDGTSSSLDAFQRPSKCANGRLH